MEKVLNFTYKNVDEPLYMQADEVSFCFLPKTCHGIKHLTAFFRLVWVYLLTCFVKFYLPF